MNSCPFCDAPSQDRVIKENNNAYAVICKEPLVPEHTLIFPKKHTEVLSELTPEEIKDFITLLEEMVVLVERVSQRNALVTHNAGHATVDHVHYHVFPSQGNTRQLVSAYEHVPERAEQSDSTLAEYAKRLREV